MYMYLVCVLFTVYIANWQSGLLGPPVRYELESQICNVCISFGAAVRGLTCITIAGGECMTPDGALDLFLSLSDIPSATSPTVPCHQSI
jgi:hypothetical protein